MMDVVVMVCPDRRAGASRDKLGRWLRRLALGAAQLQAV